QARRLQPLLLADLDRAQPMVWTHPERFERIVGAEDRVTGLGDAEIVGRIGEARLDDADSARALDGLARGREVGRIDNEAPVLHRHRRPAIGTDGAAAVADEVIFPEIPEIGMLPAG